MKAMLRSVLSAGSKHRIFLVVAVLVLTALSGLVIVTTVMTKADATTSAKSDVTRSKFAGRLVIPKVDQTLIGGRETTVAEARATVNYPVPLPNTSAANETNLTQVLVNKNRDVVLVFDRGQVTITLAPAIYKDPASAFRTFIKQTPYVRAVIGLVHGRPALVISPNTARYNSNPAWVEFCNKGIDINIISHCHSVATLLAVANSMQ